MKSQSEIAHKLKQVQFRHAKKEIEALLATVPSNCAHNRQLEIAGFGKVGFCSSQTCARKGKSCDLRMGVNHATGCVDYEALHTPDDARDRVKSFFKNAPPGDIAAKYPDAAALIWALDDERVDYLDPCQVGEVDGIPVWAASPEAAQKAREGLLPKPETPKPEDPVTALRRDLQRHTLEIVDRIDGIRLPAQHKPSGLRAFALAAWVAIVSVWKRL